MASHLRYHMILFETDAIIILLNLLKLFEINWLLTNFKGVLQFKSVFPFFYPKSRLAPRRRHGGRLNWLPGGFELFAFSHFKHFHCLVGEVVDHFAAREFLKLHTDVHGSGCSQANLAASVTSNNGFFGLQSHDGSWQAGGIANDAKSKKNPAAVASRFFVMLK